MIIFFIYNDFSAAIGRVSLKKLEANVEVSKDDEICI